MAFTIAILLGVASLDPVRRAPDPVGSAIREDDSMKGTSMKEDGSHVSMHEDGSQMLVFRAADGTTFQVSASTAAEDCSSIASSDVVLKCSEQTEADCPNKDLKIMQVQSHPNAAGANLPPDLRFFDRYYLQKCAWTGSACVGGSSGKVCTKTHGGLNPYVKETTSHNVKMETKLDADGNVIETNVYRGYPYDTAVGPAREHDGTQLMEASGYGHDGQGQDLTTISGQAALCVNDENDTLKNGIGDQFKTSTSLACGQFQTGLTALPDNISQGSAFCNCANTLADGVLDAYDCRFAAGDVHTLKSAADACSAR